jgi:hypothetical protein
MEYHDTHAVLNALKQYMVKCVAEKARKLKQKTKLHANRGDSPTSTIIWRSLNPPSPSKCRPAPQEQKFGHKLAVDEEPNGKKSLSSFTTFDIMILLSIVTAILAIQYFVYN